MVGLLRKFLVKQKQRKGKERKTECLGIVHISIQMESNNLGHQELVDHPGSLLESSVQMGSFGGVPDSQVWSQDFLMDGSGNDQNNFAPHLNEVHMNEQQLLNQECDQNHLKKMEAEMSGHGHGPWEMRNPNFQPDDSLNLSSSIGGKQHVSPLPSFNLQLLDDRMHHSCTISDMGSWSMSPSSYSHSGLDMPILPQFQLSSVKDEFMSMPSYSTANSPSTFLQGYGPSDSYKANEPGLPSMIDSKTIFKSHHLGPMHHDYNNIHAAHAFLPSIPSKLSSSLLTFGSNNYLNMNMPVMEFLNSKPSEMRLHRPHSHAYLEGTKKLQNSHQSRAMSLHGGSDSSPEQKRSSGANHESTSDTVFKRPRLEPNSTLSTFKVRKEKLGDRITALQQLVSPFGKTDTASVLLEAIGYIKFLQEQVRALSMPYMKTGCSSTAQGDQKGWGSSEQKESSEARQDLRSRGLCLVPISCTLHVANDNGADYWSPSLGSTYR